MTATGEKGRNGPSLSAEDGDVNSAESRANAASGAERTRLRVPLKTLEDVQRELGRIYREGKAGTRPVSDVSKLAHVLIGLGKLIEGVDLAARVEALESERGGTR